jgi:lipopolysaccharide/colanic/teichoic acid biosynthesis glycosyltransferase
LVLDGLRTSIYSLAIASRRTHRQSSDALLTAVRTRPRSRAAKRAAEVKVPAYRRSPSARATTAHDDRPDGLRAVVKRGSDIAVALVMLACLAPVFLLVAIAIRLDSPGPVLFRQRRIGRDGREFTMLKFRSMSADATPDAHRAYINALATGAPPAAPGARGLLKLTRDGRITRVGAILRKTSLDECPQLFNVLAGAMSIVGPRPALAYELELYREEHFARFAVRPGITGLWQVCGRNRLDFYEMLELDVEYAGGYGVARDLGLILRTPWAVLRAHTA